MKIVEDKRSPVGDEVITNEVDKKAFNKSKPRTTLKRLGLCRRLINIAKIADGGGNEQEGGEAGEIDNGVNHPEERLVIGAGKVDGVAEGHEPNHETAEKIKGPDTARL